MTAEYGEDIDQYWKSAMNDYGVRAETLFRIARGHTLRAGWNMVYHLFRPGDMASRTADPMLAEIRLPRQDAVENGIYLSADSPVPGGLWLRYGVRASFFSNIASGASRGAGNAGGTRRGRYGRRFNLEPRLGLVWQTGEGSSVKASYSRTVQYIHIASNSAAGSPLDVWFQSSPVVKPQVSDQYSAGWFRSVGAGAWELSVEGYWRDLRNTIDFRDHAELILNENLEDEILVGKGYAYGAEAMVKFKKGAFEGWVGYTYSRSKRRTAGINDGLWYRSAYDRPHSLNLVGTFRPGGRWTISAAWVRSTGSPVSFPTGKFLVEQEYVPVYEGRNRHRYPAYHRLDLSATMQLAGRRERYRSELAFSVYNAYGRRNPWMITFKEESDRPGTFYAEQIYLFSVVPSVTWNFYF
ncbi:MAG: TonB-dependent receptor [Rikenellaceae bacterium]|nr:TonB-dependent receptor [Rikenellaceae bacterium]